MTTKQQKQHQDEGSMAMWIALPFGLIMPSACPPAARKPAGTIQLRARDAAHLKAFKKYCPMGPIQQTPSFDYEYRSYCTRERLAKALAKLALEIDAPRFKPTVYGKRGLKSQAARDRLHDAYLGMWSAAL